MKNINTINKLTKISFSNIELQTLEFQFFLTKIEGLQWLETNKQISEYEIVELKKIIINTKDLVGYWNEQELIIRQISFILNLVNFYGVGYNFFSERNIGAIIEGCEIAGTVDFMVAGGKYTPTNPYFFIQEYKQQKNPSGDPLAQVLAEMMVSQSINQNRIMYGCYIVGKYWNFIILEDKNYTVLGSLDSTDYDDLVQILNKLNAVKEYIEKQLEN